MIFLNQRLVARGSLMIVVCLVWVVPSPSHAQTSPTDLTNMSLSELMSVRFRKEGKPQSQRWSFGYHYNQVWFGDYLEGRKKIPIPSLIGPPNGVTYPILQTRIIQQAHIFDIAYKLNDATRLNFLVPYIRQSTEHISIVPGFPKFTITSDGAGDASITVSRALGGDVNTGWTISGGVSIPTGSITEKGHTPAGPGSQLPYTMQLGSGTWDIPMSITYLSRLESWRIGGQVLAKFRTGTNDRGYRLGHQLLVSAWAETQLFEWLDTSFKIVGQKWGHIEGNDENFPGPIYPTPVANPDAFGGEKVNLIFGLRIVPAIDQTSTSALRGQTYGLEVGFPIYQSLYGPQPKEDYRLTLSWNIAR